MWPTPTNPVGVDLPFIVSWFFLATITMENMHWNFSLQQKKQGNKNEHHSFAKDHESMKVKLHSFSLRSELVFAVASDLQLHEMQLRMPAVQGETGANHVWKMTTFATKWPQYSCRRNSTQFTGMRKAVTLFISSLKNVKMEVPKWITRIKS